MNSGEPRWGVYEACLNQAASDLAKELCSFQQTPDIAGSAVPGLSAASEIPNTKLIETLRVARKDRPDGPARWCRTIDASTALSSM